MKLGLFVKSVGISFIMKIVIVIHVRLGAPGVKAKIIAMDVIRITFSLRLLMDVSLVPLIAKIVRISFLVTIVIMDIT